MTVETLIVIISILGTTVIALIAYTFTSFRTMTTKMLSHHDELISKATETQANIEVLLARQDERMLTIESKLKIRR